MKDFQTTGISRDTSTLSIDHILSITSFYMSELKTFSSKWLCFIALGNRCFQVPVLPLFSGQVWIAKIRALALYR